MKRYKVFLNPRMSAEIHNIPYYIEDEYIWSYLARIAYLNGFESTEQFLNCLVPYLTNTSWKKYLDWRYDADRPLVDLLFLSKDFDLIRESTIFTALQLFETNWYQANKIKSYTCEYDKASSNKTYIRFPANVEKLKICPECIEEDLKSCTIHYRKVHQIPGITVCPKHGCPLMTYTGPIGFEYIENSFEKVDQNSISEYYAAFCNDLILNKRTGSLTDTLYAIMKRLSDLYPNLCVEELFDAISSDKKFIEYPEASMLLRRIMFNANCFNYLPTEPAITLIVLLFGTYACFEQYLPEPEDYKEKFLESIKDKFDLLGEYSNDFVRLQCKTCGRVFPSTPKAMIAKEGCPDCNLLLSEKSILERMLSSVEEGNWVNKSPFKSITTKMIFENIKTSEVKICSAADLVFDDNTATDFIDDAPRSKYSVSRLPENRKSEYSRLISELTNGEFTVQEQETPHRFIATNGTTSIKDCCFTRLCRRLLIYMNASTTSIAIKNYKQKLNEAFTGNKGHLLFPEDYCDSPEYQGNVSKAFSRAVRKGLLVRLSNGIYAFPGILHSLEEIVYTRFFYRYGRYIGVPVCASLLSYLKKGTVICNSTEFALIDNGEHKKRDRNIMKINDFACRVSYIQADINDANWINIAVSCTLKHKKFLKSLEPSDRELFNKICLETGIEATNE